MNPNHAPYGQPMPMQPPPPQRRHDGSYTPMPAHMRPHPGYQPYYAQQMGPMMPQYPQPYNVPNWYPYQQQQHMHPMHQSRPQYYPQQPMQHSQYAQHSPHIPVPPHQPMQHQSSMRSSQQSSNSTHLQPPSSASTTSTAPVQTPPSPPLSTSPTASARKGIPSESALSPAPQRAQSPSPDFAPDVERFYPPVPWLSAEGEAFPPKAPRQRRRILRSQLANEPVVYPLVQPEVQTGMPVELDTPKADPQDYSQKTPERETLSLPEQTPTPLTSDALSDTLSTQPTTPSSPAPPLSSKSQQTPTQPKVRPTGPLLPAVPVLAQSPTATKKQHRDSVASAQSKVNEDVASEDATRKSSLTPAESSDGQVSLAGEPAPTVAKPKPTSWANLFKSSLPQTSASGSQAPVSNTNSNPTRSEALSDVLHDMSATVEAPTSVTFLQPRGLVNTGNMCYMNSVLQVLVFCVPFYDFLSKIAHRSAHTFKSDTPLIDAIILFMQEYNVLESAPTADQLRSLLKPEDYEKYGDSFIPEYVYSAIKQLPRFREMRRGHQQDAQEFLGFLLEELHEECSRSQKTGTSHSSGHSTPVGGASSVADALEQEAGWMEVGHKQKAAITRSAGAVLGDSPLTNIFGGKLRSELKVAGNQLSVTLEPYLALQLDIGSPEVSNIVDALKGLTRSESMQGEFQTARGQRTSATKQVFIETLPPVLVLHLKRFQYDAGTKRTEKIWKKVGYPLELELPKEVFTMSARKKFAAHNGFPKYRLTGAIYHHGKHANGGHYTVDIRRQEGREWIRLDDTVIRRVRSEDVAEGGSEEDPKVLAAALERHKQGKTAGNRFEQIEQTGEEDEEVEPDRAWSQVNGHARSKSTISAVVNGAAASTRTSGPQTPREKSSIKDNKVAYLLFYQRVTG